MTKEEVVKNQGDLSPLPQMGALVEGKVVAKDRSSVFVDLGPQGTGIIYGREFYEAKDTIKDLNIGDTVFAKVIELENEDGYKELSLRDATKDMNWQKLKDVKEKDEVIKVKITGVNKGGLLANVNGIQAFLPVSQLSPENYPRVEDADKQKILKELQKFIGKTLEVKILDLLAQESKLILSEKAKEEQSIKEIINNNQVFLSLKSLKENPWEKVEKKFKKGDNLKGKVLSFSPFGAFVEVSDKIRGLCHVSEFSSKQEMEESLKVGESYKFEVLLIESKEHRMNLKLVR